MKKLSTAIATLAVTGVAGFVLAGAAPPDAAPVFGLHHVQGRYAFYLAGDVTAGPVQGPLVAVGVIEADGNGNFPFATRTLNVAGQVIVQDDEATGTYTVDPDGTGSAVFFPSNGGPPETFDFVIIDKKHFLATATGPGVVGYGTGTR